MSLFENDEYQWRETYFVLFSADRLPSAQAVEELLSGLNRNYELRDVRGSDAGGFESLTLLSPDDYAAMDLSCVTGEEVCEQVADLAEQLRATASREELEVIDKIAQCTARLEVYHFEQLVFVGSSGDMDEPDDFMDPGSLLVVLEKIAELCDGIVVDPQASSLL